MKVSSVKLMLTEEDILNILEEYVSIQGLIIKSIKVKEIIEVKGIYKKKITIPFTAELGLGNIFGNIVNMKLLKVRISKIGIFKGIKNIALKKILVQFQEYGVKVDKDTIIINLDEISKLIPYFFFKLKSIDIIQGAVEVEAEEVIYSERKPIVNLQKSCGLSPSFQRNCGLSPNPRENCGLSPKVVNSCVPSPKDEYTRVREKIRRRVPDKYDRVLQYTMLVPDITALLWRLLKDNRVPVKAKVKLGAVIAYLASPVDILPDFIPLIGKVDDVAIAFFGLNAIINEVPEELILQNWQGEENVVLVTKEAVSYISKVVGSQNLSRLLTFIKKMFKK
jgi:uncharacterized membrane protein YkvA (DUF1232 family)